MRRALWTFASTLFLAASAACSGTGDGEGSPDAGAPADAGQPRLNTDPRLQLDLGTLQYLFGEQQSYPGTITLINEGTAPLKITRLDFIDANPSSSFDELAIDPPIAVPFTIAPEAGANTRAVTFLATPRSAARKEWAMVVKSDDPVQQPQRYVAIVATTILGPPCNLLATPPSLNFGTVAPLEQRTETVTLRNMETYRCVIKDVHLKPEGAPEFAIVMPVERAVLDADGTLEIPVKVTAGPQAAALSSEIVYTTANNPGIFGRIPVAASVEAP